MELLAPEGPVYQAGTLSGNPLATTAGIENLTLLSRSKTMYSRLETITKTLCEGVKDIAAKHGVPLQVAQLGSLFTLFFSKKRITNYREASSCNLAIFPPYFRSMLEGGIYLPPSPFETSFVSAAHTTRDVAKTLAAAEKAFTLLGRR